MNKQYKYLAVGAHPDDMEIRIGGTLIKLSEYGRFVGKDELNEILPL